jgi:glycosyltransferase involved in cell wall biosynthesis
VLENRPTADAATRVTAFVHLARTGRVQTGVGRHTVEMVTRLSRIPNFEVNLLVAKDDLSSDRQIPIDNSLHGLPVLRLPFARRTAEWSWKSVGKPNADRWCADADWVYCPAEAYVPVRRSRLAVTVHDLNAFETDLPWSTSISHQRFALAWRQLFRKLRRNADLILAVSEFTKRRLIDLVGIDSNRISVVGNGAGDRFFQTSEEGPRKPYVLCVGGLGPRKGGDVILTVAQQLKARNSGLSIWVVGDNRFEHPPSFVDNVRLMGSVSSSDLRKLYREATALFFPSRYEGFGIPVIEAMASGTPVVCSNAAALPEVAGDAAILQNVDDIDGATESIIRVSQDHDLRDELIARGRGRAELFRWSKCVERLASALSAPGVSHWYAHQGLKQAPTISLSAQHDLPAGREPHTAPSRSMTSAVVITSYNRCNELEQTCIQLQKLDPQPDEFIVCLDGCTDESRDVLVRALPQCQVIENPTRQGSIPSRDRAFRLVESDVIITLDDDSYPIDPAFVRKIFGILERHPEAGAITFPELRDDGRSADARMSPQSPAHYVRDFPNCAGVLRRSLYGRVAKYPTFFSHAYAEPDYCLQLYAAGHAVWFEPSLLVRHHFASTERNMIRRHGLNARNELWSVLLRCPFPLVLVAAPLRIVRQFVFAVSQGWGWWKHEPSWWMDAMRGASQCIANRETVHWRDYWAWTRLARRPSYSVKDLERRFCKTFASENGPSDDDAVSM